MLVIALLITVIMLYFRSFFLEFQGLGYFGAFLISLAGSATVIIPVPSWVVVFTMVDILDPFLLGIVVGVASALGETTGYLAGLGGVYIIDGKRKKYFKKAEKWMDKHSFATLFALSLIPNPLFDIAGIVAGAMKLKYWKFLLPVLFGKSLRFIIIAYLVLQGYNVINGWL